MESLQHELTEQGQLIRWLGQYKKCRGRILSDDVQVDTLRGHVVSYKGPRQKNSEADMRTPLARVSN